MILFTHFIEGVSSFRQTKKNFQFFLTHSLLSFLFRIDSTKIFFFCSHNPTGTSDHRLHYHLCYCERKHRQIYYCLRSHHERTMGYSHSPYWNDYFSSILFHCMNKRCKMQLRILLYFFVFIKSFPTLLSLVFRIKLFLLFLYIYSPNQYI